MFEAAELFGADRVLRFRHEAARLMRGEHGPASPPRVELWLGSRPSRGLNGIKFVHVTDRDGKDLMVVFENTTIHLEVWTALGRAGAKLVSAGFIADWNAPGRPWTPDELECFGESESIGIPSIPAVDNVLLRDGAEAAGFASFTPSAATLTRRG